LNQDVDALGLQLGHDLRHERNPVLAFGGLLRNTHPHEGRESIRSARRRAVRPRTHRSRTPQSGRRVWQTRQAVTVNLTRIYTKLGDSGETHLGDMSRVSKLH